MHVGRPIAWIKPEESLPRLSRIPCPLKPEPCRYPMDMGVHGKALGTITLDEEDARCLHPYARYGDKLLHVVGHLIASLL